MAQGRSFIVFGATGISGTAALSVLLDKPESEVKNVVAVSRREPVLENQDARLKWAQVDLVEEGAEAIANKIKGTGVGSLNVALMYAYIAKDDPKAEIQVNDLIMNKTLAATHLVAPGLDTFALQTGYKYYGVHLGPKKGMKARPPFREDSPRHDGDDFYFVQEDLLKKYASKHGWHWSIVRPNLILGLARGNFMNLLMSIAVYATIKKEMSEPLIFPGNAISWASHYDHSTAINNAEFEIWAATNPKAQNEVFNIHNDDSEPVRWNTVWPKIADYFGMPLPSTLFSSEKAKSPEEGDLVSEVSAANAMKGKNLIWSNIATKHHIDEKTFEYATFPFLDFATARTWSDEGSMEKARSFGWTKSVNTWESYKKGFDDLKKLKMIPNY